MPPDVDLESCESPAKEASWNRPDSQFSMLSPTHTSIWDQSARIRTNDIEFCRVHVMIINAKKVPPAFVAISILGCAQYRSMHVSASPSMSDLLESALSDGVVASNRWFVTVLNRKSDDARKQLVHACDDRLIVVCHTLCATQVPLISHRRAVFETDVFFPHRSQGLCSADHFEAVHMHRQRESTFNEISSIFRLHGKPESG